MSVSTNPTLNDQLDDLYSRLAQLEQMMSNPAVVGNAPQTVILGPPGNQIVLQVSVSPPTGLLLTTGNFGSNIWVQATWTPPTDQTAVAYEVEIARKNTDGTYATIDARRTSGNTIKFDSLIPTTTYGVRVFAVGTVGTTSTILPPTGYQDIATGKDLNVPLPTTGVVLFGVPHGIIVRWNLNTETDIDTYRVELSTNNTMTNIIKTNNVKGSNLGGNVTAFSDLTSGNAYYVRVTPINVSGIAGPASTVVTVIAGQNQTSDLAAGAVTGTNIAGFTITGVNIAGSAITGDKIQANTIDAGSIKTSTLSAATITLAGGQLQAGNPPNVGLILNSQGLRLYSGGQAQVILDSGGTATFFGAISAGTTITAPVIQAGVLTGSLIQTATGTAARIVLDSTLFTGFPRLRFWTGLGGEADATVPSIHASTDGSLVISAGGAGSGPKIQVVSFIYGFLVNTHTNNGTAANFTMNGSADNSGAVLMVGRANIKGLLGVDTIQIRNNTDTDYADLVAKNISSQGQLNINGSLVFGGVSGLDMGNRAISNALSVAIGAGGLSTTGDITVGSGVTTNLGYTKTGNIDCNQITTSAQAFINASSVPLVVQQAGIDKMWCQSAGDKNWLLIGVDAFGGNQALKYVSGSLQARSGNDSSYYAMAASAFNLSSRAEFKKGAKPLVSALDMMRSVKLYRYRHRDKVMDRARSSRSAVGPMYHELPDELRFDDETYDLATVVGMLWRSLQELSDKVDRMAA